jgi:hypothetical protein
MTNKTKNGLFAAIVLSVALIASAAIKYDRITHVHHRAIFNKVPNAAPPSGVPL